MLFFFFIFCRGCFSSHEEYHGPDGSIQIVADTDGHQKMPTSWVGTPTTEKKFNYDKKFSQVLSPYNAQDNENIVNGIAMLKNLKVSFSI